MSIEEKAKAYEMALEAARKELGVDRKEWEVVQRVLHNIFPELRESEDKNIRKELIEFIKSLLCNDAFDRYKLGSWIAYLEKQKEQKPVEYGDDIVEDAEEYTSKVDCGEYGVEVTEAYIAGALREHSKKPVEWSEEDESFLDSIEDAISSYYDLNHAPQYHYWLEEKLKSLRPGWKPTEEQIDALAYAIQLLDDGLSPKAAKAGEELESLREQLKKL